MKQESIAPRVRQEDDGHLASVAWHPEEPLTLYILTKGWDIDITVNVALTLFRAHTREKVRLGNA